MTFRNVCELAAQLDDAIEHLAQSDVKISGKGRFSSYQKILSNACRAKLGGRTAYESLEMANTKDYYTAMCETYDFARVVNISKDVLCKNKGFVKRIVKGTESYTDSSKQDQGRDTQFQIGTAAFLSRSSSSIDVECPADVMAVIGKWPVAVECKRPSTLPAIGNRIEEAYTQFKTHEKNSLNAVRFIAMDLTKIVNPQFKVLEADTTNQIARLTDQAINETLENAKDSIDRAKRNVAGKARVDGIIFRILCMVVSSDGKNQNVGEFWRVAPLVSSGTQAREAFSEVVNKLPSFQPNSLPQLENG